MKTVIEMAREAGFSFGMTEPVVMVRYIPQDGLERFAEIARAEEREACAKLCEDNATDLSEGDWDSACINCADHIRKRRNT